ncbi:hypothetical protein ASPWEDRAFT_26922 [Aspergillus wentii DTO 134E9]|uniref:Glutamate--tRNA ligase, mitochondrial n=1 Tax=Aspergillus wentii DTO 134E9 TaxID=1073089 RepID=A0A1L9RRL5_ASPWE|nr:uncharacterized protein ASPWEDRAFT_26922 [Aspergillus wentii DTO 134E9]KAI9930394.1 Glutamate--tRNA ligase mitochondrial [Aspergillus wentii]OJJ37552.1 hypothetical protein ASPWEDRAFT_26922 [Aspergillus wentii DTO 134E9]
MRRPQAGLFARRSWVCTQCRAGYSSVTPGKASNLRAGSKTKTNLPDSPARTRFAPSPTGYLHLGSLRTALFNYLLAKRTGGQFLLRIEDTDQKRTIPDAEQRLYDDLQWAGLHWDEGPNVGGPYGPYRQSERTQFYHNHADDLIRNGHAYRCFCSSERLDAHARHRSQAGLAPGYDRTCADISEAESMDRKTKGESFVVRLKVDGYPMFNDLVYGKTGQSRSNNKLDLIDRVYDDPILLKSDGHPTYHLANVVDDHLMKITHVVRGTEWMPSTPMHVALYNAFGWTPPRFGHVPLLVDQSGQKLSKRNADIDLSSFKDKQGIFPEALANFAALLGWSHTQKSDIFSLEELEQIFNLKITKGNTIVAFEKLGFLQKAHAQRFAANGGPSFDKTVSWIASAVQETYSPEQLAPILQNRSLTDYIAPLFRADAKSYTNAQEFVQRNSTFFTTTLDRSPYTPVASSSTNNNKKDKPASPANDLPIPITALHTAAATLCLVPKAHWTIDTHRFNISSYDGSGSFIEDGAETLPDESTRVAHDKRFKKELYHYLRWALSGGAPGPGIPETLEILGRDLSVQRLQEAKQLTAPAGGPTRRAKPPSKPKTQDDLTWMGSLAPRS